MRHAGHQLAQRRQFFRTHQLVMQARIFDGHRQIRSQDFELHDFGSFVYCAVFRGLRRAQAQAAQVRAAPGNQRDEHFVFRGPHRGRANPRFLARSG